MPWLDKHTVPRLARSTLNELQQNQHEKASLVCVQCTEPVRTGIGAVCVEYGRPKWPITMLNHTSLVQENFLFIYFWHPTHARTTRHEEAFLPEGKKRPI